MGPMQNQNNQNNDGCGEFKPQVALLFFVILLIFLHDLPLFNFESLLTDQFLHFTNLNRVQIAISFLF